MIGRRALVGVVAAVAIAPLVASCTVGGGQGSVTGTLFVPDCWSGKFDLQPDFFAASPYRNTVTLRIQRSSDLQNFSDGASILVNDVTTVRTTMLGQPLKMALPPDVTPPGVPVTANPDPPLVQFALYLQRTCRPETPGLYAVEEATTNADGSCDDATRSAASQCGSTAVPPAVGKSTITFSSLFDGNPDEGDADKRLTEATFDVYLADPRDECPGGVGPPPPCRGHLQGSFRFYFERGQPAQAFP